MLVLRLEDRRFDNPYPILSRVELYGQDIRYLQAHLLTDRCTTSILQHHQSESYDFANATSNGDRRHLYAEKILAKSAYETKFQWGTPV